MDKRKATIKLKKTILGYKFIVSETLTFGIVREDDGWSLWTHEGTGRAIFQGDFKQLKEIREALSVYCL